jgi:uncharacterized protein YcfJ
MNRTICIAALLGLSLAGCETLENDPQARSAGTGAAIGAAGGAIAGAVIDGVSPVEGAVAGAVTGGVVGAVTGNQRQWSRDDRGNCYYINRNGERIYDYNRTRC